MHFVEVFFRLQHVDSSKTNIDRYIGDLGLVSWLLFRDQWMAEEELARMEYDLIIPIVRWIS